MTWHEQMVVSDLLTVGGIIVVVVVLDVTVLLEVRTGRCCSRGTGRYCCCGGACRSGRCCWTGSTSTNANQTGKNPTIGKNGCISIQTSLLKVTTRYWISWCSEVCKAREIKHSIWIGYLHSNTADVALRSCINSITRGIWCRTGGSCNRCGGIRGLESGKMS